MKNWAAHFLSVLSCEFIHTKLVPHRFLLETLNEPQRALGGLIFLKIKSILAAYSNLTVIFPLHSATFIFSHDDVWEVVSGETFGNQQS